MGILYAIIVVAIMHQFMIQYSSCLRMQYMATRFNGGVVCVKSEHEPQERETIVVSLQSVRYTQEKMWNGRMNLPREMGRYRRWE
jgi:hypothetical protein